MDSTITFRGIGFAWADSWAIAELQSIATNAPEASHCVIAPTMIPRFLIFNSTSHAKAGLQHHCELDAPNARPSCKYARLNQEIRPSVNTAARGVGAEAESHCDTALENYRDTSSWEISRIYREQFFELQLSPGAAGTLPFCDS